MYVLHSKAEYMYEKDKMLFNGLWLKLHATLTEYYKNFHQKYHLLQSRFEIISKKQKQMYNS